MDLVVRKYGGSSLATPAHILRAAQQTADLRNSGKRVILVVSAMGTSTDQLIRLARKVSPTPPRRELDMLITTGERVSMSLLSMALHDLNCPAISFTGSQAGVLTSSTHSDATILDIKPIRVEAALDKNQVVVLAGFQGVDPKTKEVTTLGRGGSDTTAVAVASYFQARACEILKDVKGIFSADPKKIDKARLLPEISYDCLLEMCFWGAQILHDRSVALARKMGLPLHIGSSETPEEGTLVTQETNMYESHEVLSVNSHELVHRYTVKSSSLEETMSLLKALIHTHHLPWPQILHTKQEKSQTQVLLTGKLEELRSLSATVKKQDSIHLAQPNLSTVTLTAYGGSRSDFLAKVLQELGEASIPVEETIHSSLSLTFVIKKTQAKDALRIIHQRWITP